MIRMALRSTVGALVFGATAVTLGGAALLSSPGAILDRVDSAAGNVSSMLTIPSGAPDSVDRVIEGLARVIDGDTLDVGGQRIRLAGIQAPEEVTACLEGGARRCLADSARKLDELIARLPVRCRSVDVVDGQVLAQCFTSTQDLGREMVRSGYAKAYRAYGESYSDEELIAQTTRRGYWAGDRKR